MLIEHDMDAVFALADRVSVLVYGRIIADWLGGGESADNADGAHRLSGRGPRPMLSAFKYPGCFMAPARRCSASILNIGDRRGRDPAGAQRHGQDDHHQRHHGPDPSDAARHRHLRRQADGRAAVLSASPRPGIGLVPEGRQIFPDQLTVEENLVATAAVRHPPARWTLEHDLRAVSRASQERRARNLGTQLSGGEQQMLADRPRADDQPEAAHSSMKPPKALPR